MKLRGTLILLLATVSLAALLIAAVAMLQSLLPEPERYRDVASLAQTLLTILALLVGGAFAAYKLELFRDFEPHLTLSHTINYRSVGDSYLHIDVAVRLHNSSKVKVALQEGFWMLQQIAPLDDAQVEEIVARSRVEDLPEFPWPVVDEGIWLWDDGQLVIEPGETHQELVEILVPHEVGSLRIYTFCRDPHLREWAGWDLSTVFDTME